MMADKAEDMENSCKPVELFFEHYTPSRCDPDLNPIIFVHGIADSGKTWKKVKDRICEETKRQAYVIDLRNHGKSDWNDTFSIDSVCMDIEHFMAQNGIKKCVFVSHSHGGRICMLIALKKPELVEKIVAEEARLMNATPTEYKQVCNLIGCLRLTSFLPKHMNEKDMRDLISRQAKQFYPDNPDIEMALYYIPGYKGSDGAFHLEFNVEALERSIKDRSMIDLNLDGYQKYTGPALILYGSRSTMEVAKDDILQLYFPNSQFCRFEKGGHQLHNESEDEFVKKVCMFINN